MTAALHFRQIDPSRNRARFYVIELVPTLFGETVLLRRWGRIGTRGRQSERLVDPAKAENALRAEVRLRLRRGYRSII